MTHLVDGLDAPALASRLGVPRVVLLASVTSTMDEAHQLASCGAVGGTLVVADEQTSGRGRGGRRWTSYPYHGLWLTLLERPDTESGIDVLSLRLGLHAAPILERFAGRTVRVKWPNDLYVGPRKLAGILVEARWRSQRPEWVAIGVGVNIATPADVPIATALRPTTSRVELLEALVPVLRAAAAAKGPLTATELSEFAARDYARGRRCARPARGVVQGITTDGLLIVASASGVAQYRSGSLELAADQGDIA